MTESNESYIDPLDVTKFAEVLNPTVSEDVIIRRGNTKFTRFSYVENEKKCFVITGTTDDVLPDDNQKEATKEKEHEINDGSYTKAEFEKDFLNDDLDPDEAFENDSRQNVTDYDVIEREEQTVEDLADTISSSEAFRGQSKNSYVLRVKLPREDPRTIDLDVLDCKIIMFSHKYKMRVYFPRKIVEGTCKSSFVNESGLLEVVLRQQ